VTPNKPHIFEEQLAALVEGGLEGSEARTVKEHLTGCRACMAAYVDAVHLREHWRQNSTVPQPGAGESKPRRRPQIRLWLLAAIVPLLIMAGAWFFLSESRINLEDLDPAFGQVIAAVATASHEGMILPGGAGADFDRQVVYRSGGSHSPELSEALTILGDLPSKDFPESLRYLSIAGELADNNWETARILVENETPIASEDPDILLLAGIVAYMDDNLEESEKYLRKALEKRPNHPETMFNLALLLAENDQPEMAREIYQDLVKLDEYPLLYNRTKIELSKLGE